MFRDMRDLNGPAIYHSFAPSKPTTLSAGPSSSELLFADSSSTLCHVKRLNCASLGLVQVNEVYLTPKLHVSDEPHSVLYVRCDGRAFVIVVYGKNDTWFGGIYSCDAQTKELMWKSHGKLPGM